MTGFLTKEMCIASFLFARQVAELGRKSGFLYVAFYLQQCAVCLMTYRGDIEKVSQLSVSVSLTGSGLPRILPPFHRRIIKEGGLRGDCVIQFSFSVFTRPYGSYGPLAFVTISCADIEHHKPVFWKGGSHVSFSIQYIQGVFHKSVKQTTSRGLLAGTTPWILLFLGFVRFIPPFPGVVCGRTSIPGFVEYEILGDDLLIADEKVASIYCDLLQAFDVKVARASIG